ncbi:MAG: TonB-dependent receptor, partial [Acidobacteria bacterium]|nr:TonB-dependent receptor [Acidobacteriota bacterium]
SVLAPLKTYEFSGRIDHQLSKNNTIVFRSFGEGAKTYNAGLSGFDLPSRAYNAQDSDATFRMTETAIISPTTVNESSFQYIRRRSKIASADASPTVRVQDAFTGGGANTGNAFNHEDRLELQNFTTLVHGDHQIKFGARLRHVRILDVSPGNFAGTFTFTSLDQYRNTIQHVAGAMPSQFTIAGGNPAALVTRTDVGIYALDDWRMRPNLTLSFGLRYEMQTNISDHGDIAPRLSVAWSPKGNGKPKTVFRGGFGIFYDRFSESLTLQTLRFDGINQQQFVVTDPAILSQAIFTLGGTVTNVPTVQTLAAFAQPQTVRTTAAGLKAPRTMQMAASVERQLPYNTTVSVTYVFSHADRLLRSRNTNAPINGVRPNPALGNIFAYDASGRLNQHQILVNFRSNISKRVSLFGNYAFGKAKSDTDGAGTFPANQYSLADEYGPASTDIRHRFVLGGNLKTVLGVALSPFLTYRTGVPFNITTGVDNNGDTLFTDRPSFGTVGQPGVVVTRFGIFNPNPGPGDTIIQRNYGRGPSFFVTNLRVSREWTLFDKGKKSKSGKVAQSSDDRNRTGTNSPFSAPAARGGGGDDDEGGSPYKLELFFQVRNLLNHTNGGTPIGNLSSPLFGDPVSLASGFGFGGGRQSGGNRRFRWEATFSF